MGMSVTPLPNLWCVQFQSATDRRETEVREGESDKERGRREKGEGMRGPPSHFFSEDVALHSCSSPTSPCSLLLSASVGLPPSTCCRPSILHLSCSDLSVHPVPLVCISALPCLCLAVWLSSSGLGCMCVLSVCLLTCMYVCLSERLVASPVCFNVCLSV